MSGFDAARFQALRRGAFGADLRCLERCGSTQDEARRAAQRHGAEGCVVLAESQDAGRGRWGRHWEARPGQSLLLSVLLRAEAGLSEPGSLPLLLGLATAEALRGLGLAEAGLKWPNDLWWRGRKLGGLLVESNGGGWVAGLGLNCLQAEDDFPPELRGQAASLALAGLALEREAVLAALLERWEHWLGRWRTEGPDAWLPAYAALDQLRGRALRARAAGAELLGRGDGVEADGSLRLRLDGGELRRLQSAELELIRPL